MTLGFWIGHGPKKIVVPITFAMVTIMVTAAWSSYESLKKQIKLNATIEATSAQRAAQLDSLQVQLVRLQSEFNSFQRDAVTREQITELKNDLKADIRELRTLMLSRGRE